MHTEGMTSWDGVTDLLVDDEPAEFVRAILAREPDGITAQPLPATCVAAELLVQLGPMDTIKLQKLLYYVQAEHLRMYGVPLFPERIEAWAHGPVVRDVYRQHRRRASVSTIECADAAAIGRHLTAMSAIAAAVTRYGSWPGWQLRELSHREQPWTDARVGLAPAERSDREISTDSMLSYYRQLADIPEDDQETAPLI